MDQSLLGSVAETQVSWTWMIRFEWTRNTVSEAINHFSVDARECFSEEVLFELNLEEQVEA